MRILVAIKRVVDYNIKVHPSAEGKEVETTGLKMSMNPFDEIALEEAVRLKEKGFAQEVIAVSIGEAKTVDTLRIALAMGADRAVHVVSEALLEPLTLAKLLSKIVEREKPDMVLMGKQATDNDASQVPQMLSALLDWPIATCVNKIEFENAEELEVWRETDEGILRVAGELPVVISADLRLAEPRYVTLPNMMKAKKKPVEAIEAASLGVDLTRRTEMLEVIEPAKRASGVRLESVDALIDKLVNEKKVLKE